MKLKINHIDKVYTCTIIKKNGYMVYGIGVSKKQALINSKRKLTWIKH